MDPENERLRKYEDERVLVSVRRADIDDHSLQGFVLAYSDRLLLLHYVRDFTPDGLLAIRRCDITSIKSSATDRFQTSLLDVEGVTPQIAFETGHSVKSFRNYLRSLPRGELVILEDELADDPEFLIGELIRVDRDVAHIRYFNGTAEWDEDPSVIELDRITSCQVGSSYISFYARHFARQAGRQP